MPEKEDIELIRVGAIVGMFSIGWVPRSVEWGCSYAVDIIIIIQNDKSDWSDGVLGAGQWRQLWIQLLELFIGGSLYSL